MQATLSQRDHDSLIERKIESEKLNSTDCTDNGQHRNGTTGTSSLRTVHRGSVTSDTCRHLTSRKNSKRKSIDWADRTCQSCATKRYSETVDISPLRGTWYGYFRL